MINKELSCIVGIVPKPVISAAKAKAVAPGVHVLHQARVPTTRQAIGKNDLQITDAGLLKIISACIPNETVAARPRHANDVTTLVQQGMDGCISSNVNRLAYNTSLRLAPVTAGDSFAIALDHQAESVVSEELRKITEVCVRDG